MVVLGYYIGDIKFLLIYIVEFFFLVSYIYFVFIFIVGVMIKCVISGSVKFCVVNFIVVFVIYYFEFVVNGSCRVIVCMSFLGFVRKNYITLSCFVN